MRFSEGEQGDGGQNITFSFKLHFVLLPFSTFPAFYFLLVFPFNFPCTALDPSAVLGEKNPSRTRIIAHLAPYYRCRITLCESMSNMITQNKQKNWTTTVILPSKGTIVVWLSNHPACVLRNKMPRRLRIGIDRHWKPKFLASECKQKVALAFGVLPQSDPMVHFFLTFRTDKTPLMDPFGISFPLTRFKGSITKTNSFSWAEFALFLKRKIEGKFKKKRRCYIPFGKKIPKMNQKGKYRCID